jgi:hypothetical protein
LTTFCSARVNGSCARADVAMAIASETTNSQDSRGVPIRCGILAEARLRFHEAFD